MDGITTKIKDYIKGYAKRLSDDIIHSASPIEKMNGIDIDVITNNIKEELFTYGSLSGHEVKVVDNREFDMFLNKYIIEFLPSAYLAFKHPDMDEDMACKFLHLKGSDYFEELRFYRHPIKGRYNAPQRATEKQLKYIKSFVRLKHEEEMSSVEANVLINHLAKKTIKPPYYYNYYVLQAVNAKGNDKK